MPRDAVVAIHLEKATGLAWALAMGVIDLDERVGRLAALLAEVGEDQLPARRVGDAASILRREYRRVAEVVARVDAWERAGALPAGLRLSDAPLLLVHRDPWASLRAARSAVDAWRAGDRAALARAAEAGRFDPVFAAAVLGVVGVDAFVRELGIASGARTAPAGADDTQDELIGALSVMLAATSRDDMSSFSVADLVQSAEKQSVPLAALPLLLTAPASYDADFLVAMVDEVVIPMNEAELATLDGGPFSLWTDPITAVPDGRLDVRQLVFEAVAANGSAAAGVLESSDLSLLLPAGVGYLPSAGAALGDVLIAGGTTRGSDDDALARLTGRARRLIGAVGRVGAEGPVTPGAIGVLPAIAAPWIGSFGDDHLAAVTVPDRLPALDAPEVDAFLAVVMDSRPAADEMRVVALEWAGQTAAPWAFDSEGLAAGPAVVGDVLGRVDHAYRSGEAARRATLDEQRESLRRGWDLLLDVPAVLPVPAPVKGVVDMVEAPLVDKVAPRVTEEYDYLVSLPGITSSEQVQAEYLMLAMMWANRDTNRLFGGAPETSAVVTGVAPPAELLDAGRLRAPVELSPDELELYRRWSENDLAGSDARAVVDQLGAAYGRSTPPE